MSGWEHAAGAGRLKCGVRALLMSGLRRVGSSAVFSLYTIWASGLTTSLTTCMRQNRRHLQIPHADTLMVAKTAPVAG